MTTSRRLPARVYWVRRAVVIGVPVLLLVLVVGLAHPWTGRAADRAAARASTSAPASTSAAPSSAAPPAPATTPPAPAPTPTQSLRGGVGDCQAAQLALALTSDAVDVAAGVSPTFTVTIKNTGTASCLVDAGDAYRELVITSGADRVWSSKDCVAPNASRRTLLLAAGQADTTKVPWNRVRSAAGCPGGQPRPGTGTYQATVNLSGATGGPAVFVLH